MIIVESQRTGWTAWLIGQHQQPELVLCSLLYAFYTVYRPTHSSYPPSTTMVELAPYRCWSYITAPPHSAFLVLILSLQWALQQAKCVSGAMKPCLLISAVNVLFYIHWPYMWRRRINEHGLKEQVLKFASWQTGSCCKQPSLSQNYKLLSMGTSAKYGTMEMLYKRWTFFFWYFF